MTAENFAAALPFACLAACFFRARLLALALIPPCLLILARVAGLVDISSASHPLRLVVPLLSLSLAMWAGWGYSRRRRRLRRIRESTIHLAGPNTVDFGIAQRKRQCWASILVFASGCTDIPALLAWRLPGEWVLVPLQIFVCLVILGVLLAPERRFSRWT